MSLRNCFLVCSLLIFQHALAEEGADPRTQAVSKEVYDLIVQAQSAAKHLEDLGIDLKGVRPENLPFSSHDITECFLRHPPSVKSDDAE